MNRQRIRKLEFEILKFCSKAAKKSYKRGAQVSNMLKNKLYKFTGVR